ncbi:MAG: hypothetical protein A2259_05050 [Candidatus Moranbacteria bacterium RIFOXYA2_FULL_43_15]|nr:MAG: hypothetical protein A2259_05050 [Candidatus Moranbacteria bacterium RIFOXYA2_FULL_43_15]
MKFIAVPHQFFEGAEGVLVHFNEETLALTELDLVHQTLLGNFAEMRTKDEVISAHDGDEDVADAVDELIELGLITTHLSQQSVMEFNLRPSVRAFRIVLTEKCNLRCIECFVVKHVDELRTMSKETLERVVRTTISYGTESRVTYHFFGGEPLLRFDYIKRAVEIIEDAIAHGKMVRPLYTITTNLTLLTEEIVSFFKKYDVKVGVSVDGPKGINDQLRVYADGRGTFDEVYANYMRLVEAGIDSHVLITPNSDFLDELPSIFTSVLDTFPMKTVTVNTPLHFETVQWTVPGEKYAKLLVQLISIARKYGVSVDSAASPPLAALAGNVKRESPCSLICDAAMALIDPDGKVSFCSQKWHSFLSVPLDHASDILQIPIHRENDCMRCPARNICGGPCPAFQRISGKSIDDNKCAFMRSLLKEVINNLNLFEVI